MFYEMKHPNVGGVGEIHHTALATYEEKGWERTDRAPRLAPGEDPSVLAAAAPPAPSPSAVKQTWIDHAVSLGADPVSAEAMTKADLIDAYGDAAAPEGSI